MKIKSKDKYDVNRFGTMLFDLKEDPCENNAINDPLVEQRMIIAMKDLMKKNDCPQEQFVRYGLNDEEA